MARAPDFVTGIELNGVPGLRIFDPQASASLEAYSRGTFMDLVLLLCILQVLAVGIYFYLALRAMVAYGNRMLFVLAVVFMVVGITMFVAYLVAYVAGWLNFRRWALQRTMWCWTASMLLPLSLQALDERYLVLGMGNVVALSLGLAIWCWKDVDRMRNALDELRLNPSPDASERIAELGAVAVGPLQTVLRGDAREPRFAALAALGQINSPRARRALAAALDDSDPEIRNVAQLWLDQAAPEPA
jgi:hypothetical protein